MCPFFFSAAVSFQNLIYPHLPHFVATSAQCNVLQSLMLFNSEFSVTNILVLLKCFQSPSFCPNLALNWALKVKPGLVCSKFFS